MQQEYVRLPILECFLLVKSSEVRRGATGKDIGKKQTSEHEVTLDSESTITEFVFSRNSRPIFNPTQLTAHECPSVHVVRIEKLVLE